MAGAALSKPTARSRCGASAECAADVEHEQARGGDRFAEAAVLVHEQDDEQPHPVEHDGPADDRHRHTGNAPRRSTPTPLLEEAERGHPETVVLPDR